jgi:hypothetical protein
MTPAAVPGEPGAGFIVNGQKGGKLTAASNAGLCVVVAGSIDEPTVTFVRVEAGSSVSISVSLVPGKYAESPP